MTNRVTVLTDRPDPTPRPPTSNSKWAALLFAAAGLAGGYLLAQGSASGPPPVESESVVAVAPESTAASAGVATELLEDAGVRFPGTILASVRFGRGLVTWSGDRDPIEARLASDMQAAEFDTAKGRIAVTLTDYGSDASALHIGRLGDLRFVTSGVTGFVWHPTDPSSIAWVEEADDGFVLVRAVVSDRTVAPTKVAVLPNRVRPVAWGSWGYALVGNDGLTTTDPDGEVIASDDLQFVAAGSDGRMVVARPAGTPLSSDWAITGPELTDQQALDRFADSDEHPVAAAVLPTSGRIVLVSNRFGDGADLARIEILSADGASEAVIRSGMIADSIAWSSDEERLAVGGYYYGSNQIRSIVLLAAADGTRPPIEVPFDDQVRPLAIRD